jgi:DeoR family transcriptional regulator, suf operon transcriptional repressor
MVSSSHNPESSTWQILEFLKRRGSASIKELEDLLGVTTTAVRQHLNTLLAEGYVERRRVNVGVGRPHHAYIPTAKINELFACHCDDLALTLLDEVFAQEGPERAAQLLDRVGDRLARRYTDAVRSNLLQERVEQMAAALGDRGVLTDISVEDDNTFILKAYNCPYHELAQEYRDVCEMDENLMRKVLGAEVNLSSCIMDGHGGCSFVVGPGKS